MTLCMFRLVSPLLVLVWQCLGYVILLQAVLEEWILPACSADSDCDMTSVFGDTQYGCDANPVHACISVSLMTFS